MKPLSNTLRWSVLIILAIVFVAGTPMLIGYSKGYRLNDALNLIATGGIFIHSDVTNANVFLDDEFVERSGTFLRNTLMQDLIPNRSYRLRVEKEGFQTWNKVLSVEPNLVTEAQVLMLPVPEAVEWRLVPATTTVLVTDVKEATTTELVVPTPEHAALIERFESARGQFEVLVGTTTFTTVKGKRVATTTTTVEVRLPEWLERVASTTGFQGKDTVREREGIVTWLDGGDLHIAWVLTNDAPPFYLCEGACTGLLRIDWQEPFEHHEFFPNKSGTLIVQTEKGIFAVELDGRGERNVHTILEGKGLQFLLDGDTIVVFDGEIFRETSL